MPSFKSSSKLKKKSAFKLWLALLAVFVFGAGMVAALVLVQKSSLLGSQASSDTTTSQSQWLESSTPWEMHVIDDSSKGADGIKVADINRDGKPDLVTGWEQGNRTNVYFHPGTEKVADQWPRATVAETPNAEDAAFADLDDDGLMDVISSSEGNTKALFISWGVTASQGPASAETGDQFSWDKKQIESARGKMMWMYAEAMQVDGKNGLDIVAAGKGGGSALGWFEAPVDPRAMDQWVWHPLDEVRWIMSIELVDMDQDGDKDILLSDRQGKVKEDDEDEDSDDVDPVSAGHSRWLENPGTDQALSQDWARHPITHDPYSVRFLAVGDLNHDSLVDVVTAAFNTKVVYSQRMSADGTSWKEHVIYLPPDTGLTKGVAVGDIDLNGVPDLIVSTVKATKLETVFWLSYQSSPFDTQWQAHRISGLPGTKTDLIRLLDLDEDGDLDVLTTEEKENLGVVWWENPAR